MNKGKMAVVFKMAAYSDLKVAFMLIDELAPEELLDLLWDF